MHPLEEAPERGRELPSLTFRRTMRHAPILPGPAYIDRYSPGPRAPNHWFTPPSGSTSLVTARR